MGSPNFFVPIALVGFAVAAWYCFARFTPGRAAILTLVGGWLLLPHFDGRFPVPYLTAKGMFVPAIVLLYSAVFDSARWASGRLRWLDVPVLVMCAQPFATALSNDLGPKEGIAAALDAAFTWGAPYALGRVYLGTPRGRDEFTRTLVGAALAYVPLCLWEVRMSPNLHLWVYGFRSWSFDQSIRLGGYRPSVFLQHGLALGMFMTVSALVAYWLWRTRACAAIGGISIRWVVAVLIATALAAKSTGAIALLAVGILLLEAAVRFRAGWVIVAVALVPTVYCAERIAGWDPQPLVEASAGFDPDRAASVRFRFDNERLLVAKAMLRPWLGWGRFGRSFIYDEDGESLGAVVDSLWIILVGMNGLVGLIAVGAVLAIPAIAFTRAVPPRRWRDPRLGTAAVFVVCLLLWAIDDLLNYMLAPVFPAMAGALVSAALAPVAARAARRAPPGAAEGRAVARAPSTEPSVRPTATR
jgi:hypothetical protein